MTEEAPAPRALLYEGNGRARIVIGDQTWDDVPLLPLEEDAPEPADVEAPILIVRPVFPDAVALMPGARVEGVHLYHVKTAAEGGSGEERRVRVREIRERKAKGDPFWSRVLRRKSN